MINRIISTGGVSVGMQAVLSPYIYNDCNIITEYNQHKCSNCRYSKQLTKDGIQ